MKRFYHPIDMRSRKAMTDFLTKHFRYFTANSWNGSQSYACNLKITRLGLDSEIVNKLFDMIQVQEFFYGIKDLINEFNSEHNYLWQAGMNGRNGGYLVLYQGTATVSEYKSFCTACGQKNYKSVKETGNICGRCRTPNRVDVTTPSLNISVYPGRGTDDGEDFEDWDIDDIRARVRLVQELDKLADSIVDYALDCANNYTVEDEEIFIPQTQKVLVPIA